MPPRVPGDTVAMNVEIVPKPEHTLVPTDILFQTSFWGCVKRKLGWEVSAFDVSAPGFSGDVLVLTRRLDDATSMVYIPQGPEHGPEPESYGPFLETMSESISRYLGPSAAFIRYDLPWADPYASEDGEAPLDPHCLRRPPERIREIRMNFMTKEWRLRKAPLDLTVADSLVVDLGAGEDEILHRMKPKTRYNIRLAERKGVRVVEAQASALPDFYDLYLQTAARNGFPSCDYRHFAALFETVPSQRHSPTLSFYLALCGREVLAGAIIAVSGKRATYLFGASSNRSRNLMGPCAVQWRAIREARAQRCTSYDMGAVAPTGDPDHPFHGMFRFKTGFGGRTEHRAGSWDYPLHPDKYCGIRNGEMLRGTLGAQI